MSDYADSGFICSLYAPDANTGRAAKFMDKQREPVSFSWLNQVEIRNALRLRVFRKEITTTQRDQSLNLLLSDLSAGLFKNAEPAQDNVLIETERLSAQHSEKLGTRSLDILHVAMAVVLGCERFLSFDVRQVKLAKAAGLKVPRI
ncbi:PIN domain-containing protein [Puniceicoccus vermicola]|uniref:Type II toxin-antitoxin system VapC family toxin n=1 Tax=Puniceicoccus vermicola TaxID=388746 RepID=A0A7X1B2A2_9BACT|nr:type II toxin-antitoxin system VapC family toxin [Puniceicoccus vermicola]